MRTAFVNELVKQAGKNKNIMLLTGDLGYTVFEEFIKKFPNQFLNAGVAESNMVGVATGLALSGKIVFCYSIASFASLKTFEQIRDDVCVHNVSVIIIGSGSGLSYSDAGPTHHNIEDIALMRTLPNIQIFAPADALEVSWCVEQAIKNKKPTYIRLGKRGEPLIYKKTPKLKYGKGKVLRKGKDYAVISTGNLVYNSLEASEILSKKGINGTVVSLHTLKPVDKNLISSLCRKYKFIITVEEHSIYAGLGGIVSEISAEKGYGNKIKIIGIKDNFTFVSGSHEYLRKKYGLTPVRIAGTIKKFVKQ